MASTGGSSRNGYSSPTDDRAHDGAAAGRRRRSSTRTPRPLGCTCAGVPACAGHADTDGQAGTAVASFDGAGHRAA